MVGRKPAAGHLTDRTRWPVTNLLFRNAAGRNDGGSDEFFTIPLHYLKGGEVMRIAFAAAGLTVVMGIGGACALMRGQPAPKQAPYVTAKVPEIPRTESARLFILSQSTEPAKPVIASAAKVASPKAKDMTGKKALARPAKAEAKSAAPKRVAKGKST